MKNLLQATIDTIYRHVKNSSNMYINGNCYSKKDLSILKRIFIDNNLHIIYPQDYDHVYITFAIDNKFFVCRDILTDDEYNIKSIIE